MKALLMMIIEASITFSVLRFGESTLNAIAGVPDKTRSVFAFVSIFTYTLSSPLFIVFFQ